MEKDKDLTSCSNNFEESQHPRDGDGKFADKGTEAEQKRINEILGESKQNKMTPADKIASVHIDPNKDNILPELNESDLEKVCATKNKPVLIKKNIIERNEIHHADISQEEGNQIIGEALYNPAKIFKGNKDGYFIFAQVVRYSSKNGEPRYGTVLIDVSETKDNFEVVHWHIMVPKEIKRAEDKNK